MFDTGADLNVVSENFAKQLSQRENIKIYPSETKVKCANGQVVSCKGKVKLSVNDGPILTKHVFDIMPDISPDMFIGLRSMKKCGIIIRPDIDAIEIDKIIVPFVSATKAATTLN